MQILQVTKQRLTQGDAIKQREHGKEWLCIWSFWYFMFRSDYFVLAVKMFKRTVMCQSLPSMPLCNWRCKGALLPAFSCNESVFPLKASAGIARSWPAAVPTLRIPWSGLIPATNWWTYSIDTNLYSIICLFHSFSVDYTYRLFIHECTSGFKSLLYQ